MRHTVIPVFWSISVGVLCGLPGNSLPDMSLWKLLAFDSFAHAFVFTVFTFLWATALSKQKNKPLLRKYGDRIAFLAGVFYGSVIEILQYYLFVRRSAEWTDLLSDAIGCLLGLLLFRAIYAKVLYGKAVA